MHKTVNGEDHASGKTLSGFRFTTLPVHGQICGSHEANLSQVNGQSYGCRQDRAFEACRDVGGIDYNIINSKFN
jgi:hypothetical protein